MTGRVIISTITNATQFPPTKMILKIKVSGFFEHSKAILFQPSLSFGFFEGCKFSFDSFCRDLITHSLFYLIHFVWFILPGFNYPFLFGLVYFSIQWGLGFNHPFFCFIWLISFDSFCRDLIGHCFVSFS